MPSPFFIVGPTAVGKTSVAVAVAERCGAEIINADAFQLYAGLDLLTAKPSPDERGRVMHHLLGTVPLSENFNVARFRQAARSCLDALARRQKPVLVVGGSGMYVKALTHGLAELPPPQPALRAELETFDQGELLTRLRALDPLAATHIDPRNKRRVIRALEVCLATGRRFSDFRDQWASPAASAVPEGVFLVRRKSELDARIKRRVEAIFANGVIEEVRSVPPGQMGDTASRMIGWRELQAFLHRQSDRRTCMEKIEIATRQYAKRQMTWFRGETSFETVPLENDDDAACAIDSILERLMRPAI